MTARERAIKLMKETGYSHVIYGYRANGKDYETDWETEMKKIDDDDVFCAYVDKMQLEIDGLEMIYAVHMR